MSRGLGDVYKRQAKRYAQTIILITHDQDIAQMADRIVRIEDGRIVSGNLGGKVGDHDAE